MILEELVNQKYDLLTANDREILTSVFRDKEMVKGMNSTQLAAFLHVSRTTLVRLLKKLDIDTYDTLKKSLICFVASHKEKKVWNFSER